VRSAAAETDRLVRLAEDLLLVARADRGRLSARLALLDPGAVLDDVVGRFECRAREAGRAIESTAQPGLELRADPARVEQALDNLVDNAFRHGHGRVRLSALEGDGGIELHVTDEGPGFPPDFLPHAFERFSRGDEARTRGGTGLGLAIVEAIARAHGGSAHARNLESTGADVWLSMPKRLNDADAPAPGRTGVG
jgi:signal transduction histidine kinase